MNQVEVNVRKNNFTNYELVKTDNLNKKRNEKGSVIEMKRKTKKDEYYNKLLEQDNINFNTNTNNTRKNEFVVNPKLQNNNTTNIKSSSSNSNLNFKKAQKMMMINNNNFVNNQKSNSKLISNIPYSGEYIRPNTVLENRKYKSQIMEEDDDRETRYSNNPLQHSIEKKEKEKSKTIYTDKDKINYTTGETMEKPYKNYEESRFNIQQQRQLKYYNHDYPIKKEKSIERLLQKNNTIKNSSSEEKIRINNILNQSTSNFNSKLNQYLVSKAIYSNII